MRRLAATVGRGPGGRRRPVAEPRLRGDCHTHSDWSDGGAPIEEMAMAAVELGHEYLVLTDHSPRLTVARGLTAARLRQQLRYIEKINESMPEGFRILTGIEVDILADGSLDQDEGLLAELDVVVGSVHSGLRDDRATMTRRMLRAVENPHLDILGHCTGRKVPAARVGLTGDGDPGHRAGRTRPPERLRRGGGLRSLRRAGQGGGDQQWSGSTGSPQAPPAAGGGGGVSVRGEQRRPRPRPARLVAVRMRTRSPVRSGSDRVVNTWPLTGARLDRQPRDPLTSRACHLAVFGHPPATAVARWAGAWGA